ncbi:hypothetical protein [Sulfuricurvum sp.]|uniref:hypothetical protein n=1 Tax=Sulfuricurvum sp. TaxID=2025608 RepID=UPI003566B403
MGKCVICNQEFEGYGHNAEPLKTGACCGSCNVQVVLERLKIAKEMKDKMNNDGWSFVISCACGYKAKGNNEDEANEDLEKHQDKEHSSPF